MAIPVSLDDARTQLRLTPDETDLDVEIEGFIADAAAWIERYTGHILVARTVTEAFRGYGSVKLRAWPIRSDAVPGVAYIDPDGLPVTLTGARLDVSGRPARVSPAGAPFWPFLDTQQLFTVSIRAGYEDADTVPGNFRRAMLVLIGAYNIDREGGDVFQAAVASAKSLCRGYRFQSL